MISGSKKSALFLICLLAILLNSGCATYYVMDRNAKNEDYSTEFRENTWTDREIYCYQGGCGGIVTNSAGQWRDYYFRNVLNGDNRIFRILVPMTCTNGLEGIDELGEGLRKHHDWEGPYVYFSETNTIPVSTTPAKLIFMTYGCYSLQASLRTLTEETQRQETDIDQAGFETLIIAGQYVKDDVLFFRVNNPSGKSDWRGLPVRSDLQWVNRNRNISSWGGLLYIVSVPFDLVTLPIQIIWGWYKIGQC